MITVIQGRPGMGKTVFLVAEALRLLAKGYDVYTNIELTLPEKSKRKNKLHRIETLEDIVNLKEGKIVLDEVQTYLNSRNWDKLDIRFQLLLQQHRKRGLDIIGATQSIKRADVVFRELVQVFYDIRKIVTFKIGKDAFGFFLLREYDPDSMESATHSYESVGWPKLFFADPFTFRIYDTTQEYELISNVGKIETETYRIVEKPSITRILLKKEVMQD